MDAQQADALLDAPSAPPSSLSPGVGTALVQGSELTPQTNAAVAQATNEPSFLEQAQANPALNNPTMEGLGGHNPILQASANLDAYKSRNTKDEVPLDVEHGADAWTRAMLSFRRASEDQVKYLENKYGEGSVRMSTDGTPIVRVMDSKTGKPKDIQVKEEGMSATDFLDLAGTIPELAGSVIATRFGGTKALGFLPKLRNLLVMAGGAEGAGAVKDVAVRGSQGSDIKPGEILGTRLAMGAGDMAVGGALGLLGKATQLRSPAANPEGMTFKLREAQKYFSDRFGVELPATPGELSGSTLLLRGEAMAKQKPGASGPFMELLKQQKDEVAKIQNIALGMSPEPSAAELAARATAEDVGSAAQQAIESKLAPTKEAIDTARARIAPAATKQIASITEATAGKGPVDTIKLGGSIREAAAQKRQAFFDQSASDYGKVYAHPEAQKYILSSDKLAEDAQALLKKMPAPETITETPTGLLDKFGNEILRDETGRKIMRNFVPPNVLTKLNDLATLKDGKFRLGDLLKMRTDVANDIAQGEAIPGMDTHYLNQIRGMLTESINTELDKLPDKTLKTLWKTANDSYAKGVQPFQKAGIAELFRSAEQPNYLGDTEVVQRALSTGKGTDTFMAYKQFFGEKSPEYAGLKRAVADSVLGQSQNLTTGYVDAGKFVSNLGALVSKNPAVAAEVFGTDTRPLFAQAAMAAAGEGDSALKNLKGSLKVSDVMNLAKSGDLTAENLKTLLEQEAALGKIYRNNILRKVGTSDFTGDKINPSEFVHYFGQAEPREIQQVMSLLGDRPDVTQQIRSQTVQAFLDRASMKAGPTSVGERMAGKPGELTSTGIKDAFGDATNQQRLKLILGAETMEDFKQLANYLAPKEVSQGAFRTAGGLQAGTQVAGLLERGDLKYVDRALKNFVLSTIYTSRPIRAWLSSTKVTPEMSSKAANFMIASTPFIEAMVHQYGVEQAKRNMYSLKSSIDRYAQESGQNPNGEPAGEAERSRKFDDLLQK